MKSPSVIIPTAIVIGSLVVALAVYMTVHRVEPSTGTGDPSLVRPIGPDDHVIGNPTAPVVLVEYADFDCEYCAEFATTMHQIIAAEGASGNVAWVYRNYPITELHPNAESAAEAAECVAKTAGNDTYWKFSDALFAKQPVDPVNYLSLAQAAGANADAVSNCMQNASSTVGAHIAADAANAQAVGAVGTPYSILLIRGNAPAIVDGAWPAEELKTAIDAAVAEAKH